MGRLDMQISPNTEREYRKGFEAEGLLVGDPNDLPEVAKLHAVLEKHRPARLAPQQESSVERWATVVKEMHELGAKPVAIFDRLRLEQRDFVPALRGRARAARRSRCWAVVLSDITVARLCVLTGWTPCIIM